MLDVIIDIIIDVIFEGTTYGIMSLICKIIPEDKLSPKVEKAVKVIVAIVSGIMTLALVLGAAIRIGAENVEDKSLGNALLIIGVSFIALLVVIRIFTPKKEKE